jgi:hypothetical protein
MYVSELCLQPGEHGSGGHLSAALNSGLQCHGSKPGIYSFTKTEFLDINLTKDSSLLLHAIHRPFYWRILK